MSEQAGPAMRLAEEALAFALVSRGLLTQEEARGCRPERGEAQGPEALLRRLARSGLLTEGQAARARLELDALLNQRLPGFELIAQVGKGSVGTVYKARQISMNRLVAVKVLHPRFSADPRLLHDLVREARLAARLSHTNIVQAIDAGQAGPIHYFVMELVEGRTIRAELDEGKVYGEAEAVAVALQVARALEHAGKRGLVHRDVKPANVVLMEDGTAKLADLGMAFHEDDPRRAQRERGLAIGTPYYMAPEQIRGRHDVDARADLYALGATLYHMVTGRPPYPSRDVDEVLKGHLTEPLEPPDRINPKLSSDLVEVVTTLLQKDRRRRYQSAEELVRDLELLQRGEAPRVARQRPEAVEPAVPDDGEGGEPAEDEAAPPGPPHARKLLFVLGVLGGLLVLSAACNVVLLLR